MFKNKSGKSESMNIQPESVATAQGGVTVAKFSLIAFLICALVLTAAGLVSHKYFVEQLNGQRHALYQAQADQIAARITGNIQGYVDVIDTVVRDPKLVQALEQKNTAYLDQWKEQFSQNFVETIRLHFIRPGNHETDASVTPPVSYACLDLARSTENSPGNVRMEVHLLGAEHQHIDIARPVYGDDGMLASLVVSFETGALQPWLKQLVAQGVHLELQQRAESGGELLLAAQGISGVREEGRQFISPVEGSAWQVAYWPSTSSVILPDGPITGFWIVGSVAVVIIALVFLILSQVLTRVLHSDLVLMVKHFTDLHHNKRIHSNTNVRMAEFRHAVMVMDQQIKVAASTKKNSKATGGSKGAAKKEKEEEAIEEVMFMTDGGITLEEVDDDTDVSNEDKNK